MPDNVVKAVKARIAAIDAHSESFDKRRADLLAQMAKLNEQLVALQAEQNDAANALMKEHDAAQAKAREADEGEEAKAREKETPPGLLKRV